MPCRCSLMSAARGRRWVVETDIANCFSAIPHEKLMQAVEERICDQPRPEAAARDAARGSDGGRAGPAAGNRHPAGRGGHAPNAKGNFCFEVTLGYRRLERGR